MKTQTKFIALSLLCLAGSLLLHNESIGINYLIYSITMIITSLILDQKNSFKFKLLKSIPVFICGIMLFIQPQTITFILWLISILILWVNTWYPSKPVLIIIEGIISILFSPFIFFSKYISTPRSEVKSDSNIFKKATPYIISAIIIGLFSVLYINSNPMIANFTNQIDLSFLEFDFLKTFALLIILNFGLTFFIIKKKFIRWNKLNLTIHPSFTTENDQQEFKIASISLSIITACLFLINLSDFFVLLTGRLPEGISYSEYVHQGFYTLLFSLSLAIALLVYFFRNRLNFHKSIKTLTRISFLWISQNIFLAVLTGAKNYMYVEVYGLTYNRIAVFSGLALTIIGLCFLILKIKQKQTNWNFYNLATVPAFILVLFISLTPLDKIITHYNLNTSQTKDYSFLLFELNHPDYKAVLIDIEKSNNNANYFRDHVRNTIDHLKNKKQSWRSWNYYTHQQTN